MTLRIEASHFAPLPLGAFLGRFAWAESVKKLGTKIAGFILEATLLEGRWPKSIGVCRAPIETHACDSDLGCTWHRVSGVGSLKTDISME